ncbi:Sulfotransferase domain protein [Pseudobythopirellula maris]|uniref:Sulfotransferase domain protein n=1 Tax=Pseudobythopirellula maris TaxID=2527991 RepID=A0A5C5ZNE3_9BACT|nr:sulfotransferase [Pseudobythopirellula maris]TWT88690.1 Sulfotransferase domain protein [Pseudobythopirellula maris]
MSSNPIFIVGCDRSGTTLLRLMLIQHSQVAILRESNFLSVVRDRRDDYGRFDTAWARHAFIRDLQWSQATSKTISFDSFELEVDEALAALEAAAPCELPGAIAALYNAHAAKQGKTIWGDKTPAYILEMEWLAEAFPGARFVHIIRDARDTAHSIVKARFQANYRKAGEMWATRVAAGIAAGKKLGPERYYEMRYEGLLQSTEDELRRMSEWLGIEYESGMLEYYTTSDKNIAKEHTQLFELASKPVDASRAFAWRGSMPRLQVADVEENAGPLLAELGYEVRGAKAPWVVRASRGISRAAFSFVKTRPRMRSMLR